MRRKELKTSDELAFEIIDRAEYGVLSIFDDTYPYQVPLSVVRDGNLIYFHCALTGKKLDLIQKNNKVSMTFVSYTRVPDKYSNEDIRNLVKDGKSFSGKIFTTEFSSTIIRGKALPCSIDEKIKALKLLVEKYEPNHMEFFKIQLDRALKATEVYKINIEEISGKLKRVKD